MQKKALKNIEPFVSYTSLKCCLHVGGMQNEVKCPHPLTCPWTWLTHSCHWPSPVPAGLPFPHAGNRRPCAWRCERWSSWTSAALCRTLDRWSGAFSPCAGIESGPGTGSPQARPQPIQSGIWSLYAIWLLFMTELRRSRKIVFVPRRL